MRLGIRDALQHIASGENPASPEWESHHLSDVMSTMDNIATASLSQFANGGDLRLAMQTLDDIEPQNEFQAAMTAYARASLQLLENLGGLSGDRCPETPSSVVSGLDALTDESKVNLLQCLSEYTDSRVNMATYTNSFPSTPFSEPNPLFRSITLSTTPISSSTHPSSSPTRASMSSRHLGTRLNSNFSTPATYDTQSQDLQTPYAYYEALSNVSTHCPSSASLVTVLQGPGPEESATKLVSDRVAPSESHEQNTALCKAVAFQALTDLDSPSANTVQHPLQVRPLGASRSFKHARKKVKPEIRRRFSLNSDPLYMTYGVKISNVLPPVKLPSPPAPRRFAPRKPLRQFSTKSSLGVMNSLPSRIPTLEPAPETNGSDSSRHFSFINRTKSLINRARFGSRSSKKKGSKNCIKIDPTADKCKTL